MQPPGQETRWGALPPPAPDLSLHRTHTPLHTRTQEWLLGKFPSPPAPLPPRGPSSYPKHFPWGPAQLGGLCA